jgi:hypothetical protein
MSADKPTSIGSSDDQPPPAGSQPEPKAAQPVDQLQLLAQLYHARGCYSQAEEIYKLILELRAREQNKE